MNIQRVRYFLALGERINISHTARDLAISQPALTKAIIRLEAEVGGKLIRREGRHTHLTALGKAMMSRFRELDASASRAEATARELTKGEVSQLQVGVMCTIGPARLTQFVAEYRLKHPSVQLVLHDADVNMLPQMLLDGVVDCAFVGATIGDECRLRYIDLYEEALVVAHAPGHRFSQCPSVSFDEVMREPYLDRLRCEFRDTYTEEMQRHDVQPLYAIRSEREDWVQALIRAGLGVSIMPIDSVVVTGIELTRIHDLELERTVALTIPTGREDNPVIQSFVKAVREYSWKKMQTRQ